MNPCTSTLLCLLVWVAVSSTAAAHDDACRPFERALRSVPHSALERTAEFVSLLDGTRRTGCEVTFETDEKLAAGHRPVPAFVADEGTELFRSGWRTDPRYQADGPGTSTHVIHRGETTCIVHFSQPARLADSGEIVRSETIRLVVQCMPKPAVDP